MKTNYSRHATSTLAGMVLALAIPLSAAAQVATHVSDAPGGGGPTGADIPDVPAGSFTICDQMAMVGAGTYTAGNGDAIAGQLAFAVTADLQLADDCVLAAEAQITQVCQASVTFTGAAPDQGVWVQVYEDTGGSPAATASYDQMVPAGDVSTTPFTDTVFGLAGVVLCADLAPGLVVPSGSWFFDIQPVDTVGGDWYYHLRTANGAPSGADSFGKDGGAEHGGAYGGPYPGGYGSSAWLSMAALGFGAGDSAMSVAGEATEPRATFLVNKAFDDGNTAEVEVTLSCNTGLPLEQTTTIAPNDGVNFVVVDFNDGAMDCTVTETSGPNGYTTTYFDGVETSDDGCSYDDVAWGQASSCRINNALDQVEVEVDKVWIDENPQFQAQNVAEAYWFCNNVAWGQSSGYLQFSGNPDSDSFWVYPDWESGTTCYVEEVFLLESGIEVDQSDCQGIFLLPGTDGSCTIFNTRLYEGIPTLSQYGLALLALLMLGVGFVAFRRFA